MSRRNKRSFRKNLKKIKIKNSTRVLLMVLSLVVFAISSAGFYDSIFKTNSTKIEKEVYTYKNDYSTNYNVNLKQNSFISDNSLPAGKTYITDLIDTIDMNIKYNYTASQSSTIKYSYKIDAVIGASYTNDGTEYSVWNKIYNLKTSDSMQSNDSISIDDNINIDYKKYNQEVRNFKQTLGMNIDAFLYIKLTVNTSTTINHQEVNNEYVSNFSITLGDKVAVVDGKNTDTKIDSVKQENTVNENNVNIAKLFVSLVFMLFSIYVIYYVRFRTKKFNTIKNEYKLELNRILKSCQDRIVIVKNQLDNDSETVIEVNDFGELIKLSEELYKPILCWISDDLENDQAWFSVISNKVKYRFILKK